MNYVTVRFPERREYSGVTRKQILKSLKSYRLGVKVILKPKHTDKHWWDIGAAIETDFLNLIRYDKKTVYVYNDKMCKDLLCKLWCDCRGHLQTDHIDKHFYDKYDFNNQESVIKLYRVILGVPYHYFIFTN